MNYDNFEVMPNQLINYLEQSWELKNNLRWWTKIIIKLSRFPIEMCELFKQYESQSYKSIFEMTISYDLYSFSYTEISFIIYILKLRE